MRLGVISDVHGNLPALEAVLGDMPAVDQLVCLGDTIGYNPWPQEAVECVRRHADFSLKGNHDRYVYRPAAAEMNDAAMAGLRYAAAQLSDAAKDWLLSLPERGSVPDTAWYAAHSHPTQLDRYVTPNMFSAMASYLAEDEGLLLGHTHLQHWETVEGVPVVNPGSVGQPRDGDPRAAYAVIETTTGAVDLRRVAYDVTAVQAAIRECGLPTALADRLADGR